MKLTEEQENAIFSALTMFYSGRVTTITAAFEQTSGCSKPTYYKYKERLPKEIALIDQRARQTALGMKSGKQLSFEARQVDASMKLQARAWEIVQGTMDRLQHVAEGGIIDVPDRDKPIVIYPRDSNEATRILVQIARGGILPEHYAVAPPVPASGNEEQERQPDMIPLLPVNANFTKVTATRPDGTKFTATVEKADDVIEGEVDEVDNL
jgi:hypothetical protein